MIIIVKMILTTMLIKAVTNSVKQRFQPARSALNMGIQESENFNLWRCLWVEHLEDRPKYQFVFLILCI